MSFNCPDCNKDIHDKTDICPQCGRKFLESEINELTKKYNREVRFGCLLIIAIIIIVGWGIKFFFFSGDSPQPTEITTEVQVPNISAVTSGDTVPISGDASEKLAQQEADKQEDEKLKTEEEEKRKQRIEYARQKNIVVVTPTGSKYHERGCRTVRGSYREMNVKQAIQRGYEPCGVCAPPLQEWKEEDFDFPVYK